MTAFTLTPPAMVSGPNSGLEFSAKESTDAVMHHFHSFLLSEVCKGAMKANSMIASNSPLTLSGHSALTETFFNQVLETVSVQAGWNTQPDGLQIHMGNSDYE